MTVATARLVRLRTEEHRRLVHEWRTEAERWLAARGEDQFQPDGPSQAWRAHYLIDEAFDRGEFVGLNVNARLAAVAAIKGADPDFWTRGERAHPQVYVARMMVAEHGEGHGEHLLIMIAAEARAAGIPVMRLDCWRTNQQLQDYYKGLGFQHLGTVEVAGRGSGAKFELDLTKPSPLLP